MKNTRLTSTIAFILLLFALFAASPASGQPAAFATEPFLFAVISDIHIFPDMNHDFNKAFVRVAKEIGGLDPQPDFVIATGDMVDSLALPWNTSAAAYTGMKAKRIPVLEFFKKTINDNIKTPFYCITGNHEYYWETIWNPAIKRAQLEKVLLQSLSEFMPALYYNVEHKGFNMIMLNTTAIAETHADSWTGSLGETQLDWLEQQLKSGKPSILFMHHYPTTPVIEKQSNIASHTMPADGRFYKIVENHKDTIKMIFVGHGENWCEDTIFGIPIYMTAQPEDTPGYHLVRVDPASGKVSIANRDRIKYNTFITN